MNSQNSSQVMTINITMSEDGCGITIERGIIEVADRLILSAGIRVNAFMDPDRSPIREYHDTITQIIADSHQTIKPQQAHLIQLTTPPSLTQQSITVVPILMTPFDHIILRTMGRGFAGCCSTGQSLKYHWTRNQWSNCNNVNQNSIVS